MEMLFYIVLVGLKVLCIVLLIKISSDSRMVIDRKVVIFSQGVCKLFFFCKRSLLREGELSGRLNFRKFSDVRVVMELYKMNGKNVRVVIIVLGNIWCRIML